MELRIAKIPKGGNIAIQQVSSGRTPTGFRQHLGEGVEVIIKPYEIVARRVSRHKLNPENR